MWGEVQHRWKDGTFNEVRSDDHLQFAIYGTYPATEH